MDLSDVSKYREKPQDCILTRFVPLKLVKAPLGELNDLLKFKVSLISNQT
jgi:hypothetical protein